VHPDNRASQIAEDKNQLIRCLTFTDTTALVIGTIIGTGVFLKTAVMAQQVGTPALVLAAWVVAGALSLAGALTYAELGAMLPHAGGEYVYLRTAYGKTLAFLYGWTVLAIEATGSIAALGAAFATFLSSLLPIGSVWIEHTFNVFGHEIFWSFGLKQVIAVGVILFFSAVNCAGVAFGGRVQVVFTTAKLLGIFVVVAGVFLFSESATWSNLAAGSGMPQWSGLKAFGAAMLAALWAYNGWNNMPMVAGEVRDPGRNVPRALIVGMLVVLAAYGLANLAYLYALPFDDVVTSNSTAYRSALPVATKAAQTFLGTLGAKFVTVAFLLSTLGALQGVILVKARIPFAMARDGLFFSSIGQVSKNTRVPARAIGIGAVWASVLAVSGSFDQLTDFVIFAAWIFYGLTAASVFVLRRKMPNAPRPYRTLGYPVVPLLFVLVALWLLINTLQTNPVGSVIGLLLILLGLPLYAYFQRRQGHEASWWRAS
jgi:basic amino acid/polyamine antiporter, APA family